jgi:hypothetical protein
MSSRLFHSVVAVGMALGTSNGGCLGRSASEDSDDSRFDPFCDAAWPTTKGNPGPPSCVDPNQECVNAGYPSHCFPLLEDGSCDSLDTQSPFCIDAQWECAPGTVPPSGCRCWGPLPVDHVCTEGGTEQRDQ